MNMTVATPAQTGLKFRHATHADIDALVALVESAYRGDASKQGWTTEADMLGGRRTGPDDIQGCIDRERSVILVAERRAAGGDELIACAHVAEDNGAGYFGMFSVVPTQQGGGIGKQVIVEAERLVREDWNLPAMRMTVIDIRDELIAFYERRGYRRTGIKKPFPYGDERYGLPMRDDLRFEVLEKAL